MFNMKVECKYHPGGHIIDDHHTGDMICAECGLVVGDRIIEVSNEWRNFNDDETEHNRVGPSENPFLGNQNLYTIIGPGTGAASLNEDGTAKYLTSKMCSADRKAVNEYSELYTMASRINLPNAIIDRTKDLLRQVNESNGFKVRSNDAKLASCLYIACRQDGVPRSFKEICAISKSSKRDIGRCFKHILKVLNTNLQNTKATDYLPRFCSQLELPKSVEELAIQIAHKANKLEIIAGKSPLSVTAAVIFIAAEKTANSRSYKQIAEVCGVAEVSIRNTYKDIIPFLKQQNEEEKKPMKITD